MESNKELNYRLQTAFFQILELKPDHRGDLHHMWRNGKDIWNIMDRELVECRRVKKHTARYLELEQDLIQVLDTIGQYLTFATLLT